ncbi:hypothetical protein Tco_0366241 [Tanacetum coccineum]
MGQSEESLASLFMSGLEPEIEKMVYFRPKTLHSAYLLANLLARKRQELIKKRSLRTLHQRSDHSLKINLSKEREKVNSALVGYHECCKANEKSEEIECMGLTSLEDICEENVKGADMELDVNNGLVVIDKVCNIAGKGNDLKSNESSEMEVNWVVRVDKPMKVEDENKSVMSVDEFVDNDARMTIGDGVTTNKMVEIKMGMDGYSGNKCLVIINEPCVSKECGKVKTTTPLKFDKKLAGFDVKIDDVFVEAFVTKIPYSEGVIRKFKKVELLDQCTVECLGGMERETCDKMRNSVKKDGSGVHEMEFIGGDIIREEGFEEDRKNGNNSFSNIVGKKKEYCVEQNERTKGNDNFVVWDSRLLSKTDYPSAISDCLATLKSEEILVKNGWKKFVFEGSANGYGTYSNSSKAQHVAGEGRGGVKLNMWWPRRKNKHVMFDIWKWPKRIKEVIGCLGKKELVHYWKVNSLCSLPEYVICMFELYRMLEGSLQFKRSGIDTIQRNWAL